MRLALFLQPGNPFVALPLQLGGDFRRRGGVNVVFLFVFDLKKKTWCDGCMAGCSLNIVFQTFDKAGGLTESAKPAAKWAED